MAKSKTARAKIDPVALASKGRITTQIETQKSDDKPVITSTLDEN